MSPAADVKITPRPLPHYPAPGVSSFPERDSSFLSFACGSQDLEAASEPTLTALHTLWETPSQSEEDLSLRRQQASKQNEAGAGYQEQ